MREGVRERERSGLNIRAGPSQCKLCLTEESPFPGVTTLGTISLNLMLIRLGGQVEESPLETHCMFGNSRLQGFILLHHKLHKTNQYSKWEGLWRVVVCMAPRTETNPHFPDSCLSLVWTSPEHHWGEQVWLFFYHANKVAMAQQKWSKVVNLYYSLSIETKVYFGKWHYTHLAKVHLDEKTMHNKYWEQSCWVNRTLFCMASSSRNDPFRWGIDSDGTEQAIRSVHNTSRERKLGARASGLPQNIPLGEEAWNMWLCSKLVWSSVPLQNN